MQNLVHCLTGVAAFLSLEMVERTRDSLAALATDTTALEISGYYCNNAIPDETEDLGLSRAADTQKLFPELQDERIILLAKGRIVSSSKPIFLIQVCRNLIFVKGLK